MKLDEDLLHVLIVGNSLARGQRIESVLVELGYEMTNVADTDEAEASAGEKAFDLILIEYPVPGRSVSEFIKGLRWSGSFCQHSVIVGLSTPDDLDEAEDLLDYGVCRILNPAAPEYRIRAALEEVLSIDERYAVHGFLRIPGEQLGLTGTIMTQTIDVSISGMMVRLTKEVMVGARFEFSLTLSGMTQPIEGNADVVRLKTIGMDSIAGFAATFASFDGDGENRLASFLAKQPSPKK